MRCSCGAEYPDNVMSCPVCNAANPNMNNNGPYNNGPYNNSPYNGQPSGGYGGYKAPIKRRDIVVCILLTIVTCGIYGIVWFISMADDLNVASGRTGDMSGGLVFLLSLITCGIYSLVWMYQAGQKVSEIRRRQGLPPNDSNGILYLVLTMFGLGIVSYCLIQSELNDVSSL